MHLKERFDAFYGSSKSCQMGDMLDKWQICRSRHLVYRCIMPTYSFWVRGPEDDILRKSSQGSTNKKWNHFRHLPLRGTVSTAIYSFKKTNSFFVWLCQCLFPDIVLLPSGTSGKGLLWAHPHFMESGDDITRVTYRFQHFSNFRRVSPSVSVKSLGLV